VPDGRRCNANSEKTGERCKNPIHWASVKYCEAHDFKETNRKKQQERQHATRADKYMTARLNKQKRLEYDIYQAQSSIAHTEDAAQHLQKLAMHNSQQAASTAAQIERIKKLLSNLQ